MNFSDELRRTVAAMFLCGATVAAQDTVSTSETGPAPADTAIAVAQPETVTDSMATSPDSSLPEAANKNTADTGEAELTASDSVPVKPDSAFSAAAAKPANQTPSDTGARFYDKPFLSVGGGWALGSMPLFDEWSKDLPDSISDMPGYDTANRGAYSDIVYPDAYNTAFPFFVSITPFVNKDGHLTVTGGGSFMSKEFTGVWRSESLNVIWRAGRSLSVTTGSIGLLYYRRIPAEYFSIANIDRGFAVIGISASPYIKITDSQTSRSDNPAQSFSLERSYRGYALSWQAGVSTFRPLSPRSGVEIGIQYLGGWFCRFMKNDHHVRWSVINSESSTAGETLQFMTHRVLIHFNLIVGRKPVSKDVSQKPEEG